VAREQEIISAAVSRLGRSEGMRAIPGQCMEISRSLRDYWLISLKNGTLQDMRELIIHDPIPCILNLPRLICKLLKTFCKIDTYAYY